MEKANFSRRLIQDNIDDSKSFWKAMNNILPSKKKLSDQFPSLIIITK